MNNKKHSRYIIWTLGLYFGWLLSFPFYGPVLYRAAEAYQAADYPLTIIFSSFHAAALFAGAIILKNTLLWKKMMLAGAAAALSVNMALLFLPPHLWTVGMAALGVSSSVYILGWSCIYSQAVPSTERLKVIASIIIIANIILIAFSLLEARASPFLLLSAASVPLLAALAVSYRIPDLLDPHSKTFPGRETLQGALQGAMMRGSLRQSLSPREPLASSLSLPLPVFLLVVFCLFTAGLYLNGGFMYTIMLPSLEERLPFLNSYKFIPYIAVLVVMYRFGERLPHYFSVYMGASLLGISFVFFALLEHSTTGQVATNTFVEAAFAFIDLFVWVSLGSLAFIYGAPFQFFGFALGAMVTSIIAGELLGGTLLQVGENYRMVTAGFAAAVIFLTFMVIPWLNERMNRDFLTQFSKKERKEEDERKSRGGDQLNTLLRQLAPGQNLTPRETEIVSLILKGLKNKEIAAMLYISENTLKTHLKHIYIKFGITQKQELLYMALGAKER